MVIIDTRGPGQLEDRIKWITAGNFPGINGDGTLNLHGFDVRADHNTDNLRILLINHRPPMDPVTGEALDAKLVGANSTIELFQTKAGSDTMRHVRTYADNLIQTPNRVAWVNDHAFVFSNDHTAKVGLVCPFHRAQPCAPKIRLTLTDSADTSIHSSAAGILDIVPATNAISLHPHLTHSISPTASSAVATPSSTSPAPSRQASLKFFP